MGTGKSTVAHKVQMVLGAKYYHERYADNPYIARLYEGDNSYTTVRDCQTTSISLTIRNLENALLDPGSHEYAIVDVTPMYIYQVYCKGAFLDDLLTNEDMYHMGRLVKPFTKLIDFHFGLTATFDEILKRIKSRDRKMEALICPDTVASRLKLSTAYLQPDNQYHESMTIIDTTEKDPMVVTGDILNAVL